MQSRDGQGPFNPYFEHASKLAATNDGTLNAIVNKSVCSVDVPLGNAASHHEDEMLSWLHYPVVDSLDRGYCSDIFGDLPKSSAQLLRHSLNELGVRPHIATFNTGAPIFSGILSHEKQGALTSINTCTMVTDSTREAVESCGSVPVEASFRVAGADAGLGLGTCQAAGWTPSHKGLGDYSQLDSQGGDSRRVENAERPTCERSSTNETNLTQSKSSQTPSQVTPQQEGTLSCLRKPLDMVNCYIPMMPAGKHIATNFAHFSRPAVESKASLHVLRQSSGPANIERVKQQTGQHGMFLESASTCNMHMNLVTSQAKCLLPPAPLTPLLPLPRPLPPLIPPHCSSPAAIERNPVMYARQSPVLAPPPSSISESRDETNLSKDTITCSRMSIMSAEKEARTADQTATSPFGCSSSSTERSGKVNENVSTKQKPGAGDESDYQSEYVEEMAATDKKSPSNAKRMRTAEMHNQSERKRRVKINDKLKTLQELIPNGNKVKPLPDKASLLDAVIEYIKLLQSQLQMISMRTGIGVPSWMIPNVNMQHVQMPSFTQMRLVNDMGMGVGLGMGMRVGMGMMDANAAVVGTGCTIVPMPPFPGQPPDSGALQSAERVQSPGMMNLYVGPPHGQHRLMNQSVPMYNTLQPRMPPQQPHFSVQFQQSHQLPGSTGKGPFR